MNKKEYAHPVDVWGAVTNIDHTGKQWLILQLFAVYLHFVLKMF